ncbi:MAG: hypothetical protein QXJ09_07815 [Candidatus Caldarchaeum sp.]
MSGPSWEPLRKMLAVNCLIDHIVISYDPSKNWAWSENTVLSEILLVCTKQRAGEQDRTKITHVYLAPRSALESKILATRIIEAEESSLDKNNEYISFGEIQLGGRRSAICYSVPQKILASCKNWNVAAGFASPVLSRTAWLLAKYNKFLGVEIPLSPLGDLVEKRPVYGAKRLRIEPMIGFDVHVYQTAKTKQGGQLIDVLEGAKIETLTQLEVEPNAQVRFSNSSEITTRMSNFLIAGVARFWLYTVGLISTYCVRPVVSNRMWTVRLAEKPGFHVNDVYKIQVLWLNSTPGLIHFLSLRQHSKGAFVQFKKEYLSLLKLLNLSKLATHKTELLLQLYNELKVERVNSLADQIKQAIEKRGFRWTLDSKLLQILNPSFDLRGLSAIYQELLHETIIHRSS